MNTPIPSYGIILFTIVKNKDDRTVYYLLGQRRDTIEYVDSIKYRFHSNHLLNWLSRLSTDEKERIEKYPFEVLWEDLMMRKTNDNDHSYIRAKTKFEMNRNLIITTMNKTKVMVKEPQWGFPKGRKHPNESKLECAQREFEEETCISKDKLRVFSFSEISECFKGSDKKMYCSHYYICETYTRLDINYVDSNSPIPNRKKTISNEMQKLGWFTLEDACKKLNRRRASILRNTNEFILLEKNNK